MGEEHEVITTLWACVVVFSGTILSGAHLIYVGRIIAAVASHNGVVMQHRKSTTSYANNVPTIKL